MKQRVLVVDDEDTIRNLLKSRLDREGFDVVTAGNADEAEKQLDGGAEFGVMITDLKMPGRDGFSLIQSVKEKHPSLRVIVITGHGEKSVAIQSLRFGATDYLEKPFDLEEMTHSLKRAMREYQLESENHDLLGRLEARVERVEGKEEDQTWYVSKAHSMEKTNEWLTILRRESLRGEAEEPSVVIQGGSGTGKEGIARMIHAGSRRAKGPWVAVNCANFSENLLESELFGHEKGAFTGATTQRRGLFEIAKNGTLFLDELGEMDVKLQAKLLRVLQEKVFRRVGGNQDIEADVRVIAATNQDLQKNVKDGKFREDLYHRLCRVIIELPNLYERSEDILPMAKQFAERSFRSRGKTFSGFTPDAEQAMTTYQWPGNVRELLNVVERVALTWQGNGNVTAKALSLPDSTVPSSGNGFMAQGRLSEVVSPYRPAEESGTSGFMELKKKWSNSFEKEYLIAILQRHGGNVSSASREAQIDRSNFLRLLRRHHIKAQEYRRAA